MKQAPATASGGGQGDVPRHVAIIMDGNGRWAKKRLLPRIAGHRKGIEAAKGIVKAAAELGIECLTLYAFSTENWNRPADEVSDLMGLLRRFIEADLDELTQNGVRLRIIGDYKALSPELVSMIDDAIARTASNDRMTLVIALNYGSQAEMAEAVKTIARRVQQGDIKPSEIDAEMIGKFLETADFPELDLLIRTSGEVRLSNFLLWQAAYAEMMFVDTLWPDFGKAELASALATYGERHRRFGGL